MKIGIISDTHDHLENLRKALEIFHKEGIRLILHAGDFISPFTVRPFLSYSFKLIGVFGNNDGEREGLKKNFKDIGEIYEDYFAGEIGGRKVFLTHKGEMVKYLDEDKFDVIIYGHTHKRDLRKEKALIINPGECGGWLYGKPTICILDLETLEVEFVEIG